ncbi:MAG: 2-oxoacid:acceptor oxidoreductase subunit alpha [Deltaproteobacteria bacterium]|nr:2-oxoacid:acceptor oxidoreductase subunit alpha [Deltaproteobacteria bacterium]
MERDELNIMIGGAAGQGLDTIGQILSKSLVREGYFIAVTQRYLSRIRGGHNTFTIRASANEVNASKEQIDILIALNEETINIHRNELASGSVVLLDKALKIEEKDFLSIPLKELTAKKYYNIAALGIVCSIIGLDIHTVESTLDYFFGKKNEDDAKENLKALASSYEWALKNSQDNYKLKRIDRPVQRLMMNGNEAIALGAMSSGLRFASFYPMSPSTSIMINLAANAEKMGMIVEQAEDEISAINMALGASFAGAPAMVSTSGGGFALMIEGVSLSAMTETPIVIALAQRPGPATGLPTGTEQGDLNLALYAGHGEFPRAIFCPGSIEECFYLTRKAFEQAEKNQGPVFILTDQYLADSYRAVDPFDIESLPPVTAGESKMDGSLYERYAITPGGISPRLLPGMSKGLVIADSDEHNAIGHITEDPYLRVQMVNKRLKKAEGIKNDVIAPERLGDEDPEILLVSWGSTRGAVIEAISMIKALNHTAGGLHFSQVWPIIPEQFEGILEGAGEVICVEGNATGQFAGLLRKETGFSVHKKLLRYDGLPITPEFIMRKSGLINQS